LAVLGGERLGEQRGDLALYLVLVVDELVEAFRRARRGFPEVLVGDVVAELAEPLEDLVVALLEEGERFGIELHRESLSKSRMAPVADEMPSVDAAASGCQETAS